MKTSQRVQVVAKRLAAHLMRGTVPQEGSTIKVTVAIHIENEGGFVDLSASSLLDEESGNGRNLIAAVNE